MEELGMAVRNCISGVAGLRPSQSAVILADPSVPRAYQEAFARECLALGANPVVVAIPKEVSTLTAQGDVVLAPAIEAVKASDVVFSLASYPLQHLPAFHHLMHSPSSSGPSRPKWINVIPPFHLSLTWAGSRVIPVDLIAKITERTIEDLRRSRRFRLTSESGSDLWLEHDPEDWRGATSFPVPPGTFSVFPPGAINSRGHYYRRTEGIAVFDTLDGVPGLLRQPLRVEFRQGYVQSISGGADSQWLDQLMNASEPDKARPHWEVGLGTNPGVVASQESLEVAWHGYAHKAAGVVHLGIGQEPFFHIHGAILHPTLTSMDMGAVIVRDGHLGALDRADVQEELTKLNLEGGGREVQ